MGTLTEIGAKFGLKGMKVAIQEMGQLKSGISGLGRTIDTHIPQSSRKMDVLAQSTHRMATSMQSSLRLAKVAVAGFLTGRALSGLGDWIKSNPDMDKWKDFFRIQGAGEKEFKDYEAHLKGLRKRVAGVEKGDYMSGIYGMQSIFSLKDTERNKKALEATLFMAKGMSPDTSIGQARQMMRTFASAYGAGKGPDETLAMMQKFGAQIPMMLRNSKAEAQDVITAMTQTAGLYKQLGRSQGEMLADIGAVAGTMHERTGEFLKNVLSRQGVGFGQFAASVAAEESLADRGIKNRADLGRRGQRELKEAERNAAERFARYGAKLLQTDPQRYNQVLANIFQHGKQLQKTRGYDLARATSLAFGETAMSGIQEYTTKHASGEVRKMARELDTANMETQKKATEAAQKSWTARQKIFTQRAEDLSAAVKKPFQAVGMELMEPWGQSLSTD